MAEQQQTVSLQQALDLAISHHSAGRLPEAESIYQQILQADPNQPGDWHLLGVIAHQTGKYDLAIDRIKKALRIRPDLAEAHSNLGLTLQKLGELEEATNSFTRALDLNPDYPEALNNLGVVFQELGKLEEAVSRYRSALAQKPDYAVAHFNLGNALKELGSLIDAEASYRKALDLKPDYPEVHSNLGLLLLDLGQPEEAIANYRKALAIEPNLVQVHYNLGNALRTLGKPKEAIASYNKTLILDPGYAEAHNNLGLTLQDLGKLKEATESYRKALSFRQDYPEAHSNLGNILRESGNLEEAISNFQAAVALRPDYPEAHNNMAVTLQDLGKLDKAIASYRAALNFRPNYAEAHNNLSGALQDQGNINEATTHIDLALSHKPEKDGWRIKKALLLSPIPFSNEEIDSRRDLLTKTVKNLLQQNLTVPNPIFDVGTPNFYLAYHDQNDKILMENIAKLHISACAELTYEAKHCRLRQKGKKHVLRIGFLSSFFYNHTIGKLTRGIIQHLSRDHFQVILFRPPGKHDFISKIIDQSADKVISLYGDLRKDQKRIEDEQPDILFYPDIGMSPLTYYLAFARLAPVQLTTWGHPDTTGIPNIDYFLSSDLLESPQSSKHYSEKLETLQNLSTHYFRPDPPSRTYTPSDFKLPGGVRLYVCPQTLIKFHPTFDVLLGELLRRDTDGRLVLLDDNKDGNWKKLLVERFSRTFPDVVENVFFVPRMPLEKFFGLLILADALLDVPTFSGGNTTLEAFAMGAPIVTWPQRFMRSRVTAACYRQMGFTDLIASDSESYLGLALQLAQDKDFRSKMRGNIKKNAPKLYENFEVIQEMETFFRVAYQRSQESDPLTKPTI